jgi:hypothetical protein
MGRVGSALDNAVIESWHTTLEFELRQLEHFTTRARTRRRLAIWIEEYNHDRRHSSLGMRSPITYELALSAELASPQAVLGPQAAGRSMSGIVPSQEHDLVLTGVKASPDPGSGRVPMAPAGSQPAAPIHKFQTSTVSGDCQS